VNQEQYTLREIIQQRFEELDAHIAALDAVSSKTSIPSFLNTYSSLKARHEVEGLIEGQKELEDRIVALENYQTIHRFATRQIITVLCTVLLVALGYLVSWYFR